VSRTWKFVIIGLAAFLALNVAYGAATSDRGDGRKVALSEALTAIDSGQVTRATIRTGRVTLELRDGRELRSSFPDTYNDDLIAMLHERRAQIEVKSNPPWAIVLALLLPFGLFAAFWAWLARRLPPRPRDEPPPAATAD
jgi:ATP-dependent Zn protease